MVLPIKEVLNFQARFHEIGGVNSKEIGNEINQIVNARVRGRKFFQTRCINWS